MAREYTTKIVDCVTCGTKFLSVTKGEHPTECAVCRGENIEDGTVKFK
tara:strand:+ start:514 stop:657 length:144 start_codon:yes stop_codon:yes gene_type:complete